VRSEIFSYTKVYIILISQTYISYYSSVLAA